MRLLMSWIDVSVADVEDDLAPVWGCLAIGRLKDLATCRGTRSSSSLLPDSSCLAPSRLILVFLAAAV